MKKGYLRFRKSMLEHAAGYDIIQLLKANGIVSSIEDSREVVIAKAGRPERMLVDLLDDGDFGGSLARTKA